MVVLLVYGHRADKKRRPPGPGGLPQWPGGRLFRILRGCL